MDDSVFELADSYLAPVRKRCVCGAPMALTSNLHCCHVCYSHERADELREMTDCRRHGGRMDRFKHYATRG